MNERTIIARCTSASVLRALTSKCGSASTLFCKLKAARYLSRCCPTLSHAASAWGRLRRGSEWGRDPRLSLSPKVERSQSVIRILRLANPPPESSSSSASITTRHLKGASNYPLLQPTPAEDSSHGQSGINGYDPPTGQRPRVAGCCRA